MKRSPPPPVVPLVAHLYQASPACKPERMPACRALYRTSRRDCPPPLAGRKSVALAQPVLIAPLTASDCCSSCCAVCHTLSLRSVDVPPLRDRIYFLSTIFRLGRILSVPIACHLPPACDPSCAPITRRRARTPRRRRRPRGGRECGTRACERQRKRKHAPEDPARGGSGHGGGDEFAGGCGGRGVPRSCHAAANARPRECQSALSRTLIGSGGMYQVLPPVCRNSSGRFGRSLPGEEARRRQRSCWMENYRALPVTRIAPEVVLDHVSSGWTQQWSTSMHALWIP